MRLDGGSLQQDSPRSDARWSSTMSRRVSEIVPTSVVIPLFRPGEHLERLGATLANQGEPEVIAVIDDRSSPSLVEEALASVRHLRVLRTNGGIGTARARNLGAEASTRQFVTFLDQDDWWDPGFLPALLEMRSRNVLAYDNNLWSEREGLAVSTGETVFGRAGWRRPSIDRAEAGLLLDGFPMLKILLERKAFLAVGGYRQIYAVEDFDLVWRLIAAGRLIDFVSNGGAHYLLHEDSTTQTVHRDKRAFERAQRSWLRIWSDMARSDALPPGVRARCLLKTAWVGLRIAARRIRDRPGSPADEAR